MALQEIELAHWKEWLSWRVVHSAAPLLSQAFVDENFDFYGQTLTGAPELRERWKRGVGVVESALGEAVGQLYVAEHFPPAAKARMVELVANLVEAYRQRIEALDWMSPETRQRALDKLGRVHAEDRLPGQVEGLQRPRDQRRRPGRQRRAARSRSRRRVTWPSSASRSTGPSG